MKRRVVVTGLGAITPLGKSMQETWENVKKGSCGIDNITLYDATNQKVKLAAEVKDFNVEDFINKKDARKMDRYTQFAVIAAEEAFKDSEMDTRKEDMTRVGCYFSSGIGGIGTIESEIYKALEKGFDRVSPFFIPMVISNMAAGHISIRLGLKGISCCTVTACASGSNAVGEAFHHIRDGYAEACVCGGAEASVTPLCMGGFTALKALSESHDKDRASIPFDKERNGFVMGEGAGALVLEEYEHAKKRGAKIYAEIIGYESNCDAYHITAPSEGGEGAARCMALAMNDAGVSPNDIDYINAHGTSTRMNDKCETMAVHRVFGEHSKNIMMSSTKSMTGHLLGASGAVEAAFTVLALKDSFIPATINHKVFDDDCDLDLVANTGRDKKINYAVSNSLGFGGHNASLVFKRMED